MNGHAVFDCINGQTETYRSTVRWVDGGTRSVNSTSVRYTC